MRFRRMMSRLCDLEKTLRAVASPALLFCCFCTGIEVWALTDEGEPQQKMVMSQFRDKKVTQSSQSSKKLTIVEEKGESKNIHNKVQSELSHERFLALDDLPQSIQTEQILKTVKSTPESPKAERSKDLKSLGQSSEKMPYEMIPEAGQPLTVKKREKNTAMGQKWEQDKKNQAYAFDKVMQWVIEASTGMMTYSGEHLDRDKKNAASYFSPQAWQVVHSTLFNDIKSPLSKLHESKGSSRAMSMDWPKSLHMDVGEHGKIWWLKVPVLVQIKENKLEKRAFYEVSLGVLSIQGESGVAFIAEEAVIKPVSIQERKIKKRARNAR